MALLIRSRGNSLITSDNEMSNIKLLGAQYAHPNHKVRAMSLPGGKNPSTRKGKGHSIRVLNLLGYMTR